MNKLLILRPRMSEKAYSLSQAKRTYIFEVPNDANKLSISKAVETQFKVSVTNVNLTTIKGKTKRTIRRGSRPVKGQRSDIKRAYITLKSGDTIPVFAAVEEAEQAASKNEKPAQMRSNKSDSTLKSTDDHTATPKKLFRRTAK